MKIIKYYVKRVGVGKGRTVGNEISVYSHQGSEGEDLWSITNETRTAMINMISKRILYQLDFSKTLTEK